MFNILCLYFVSTPKCLFTREDLCHLESDHNDSQNDYKSVDLILLFTKLEYGSSYRRKVSANFQPSNKLC